MPVPDPPPETSTETPGSTAAYLPAAALPGGPGEGGLASMGLDHGHHSGDCRLPGAADLDLRSAPGPARHPADHADRRDHRGVAVLRAAPVRGRGVGPSAGLEAGGCGGARLL